MHTNIYTRIIRHPVYPIQMAMTAFKCKTAKIVALSNMQDVNMLDVKYDCASNRKCV